MTEIILTQGQVALVDDHHADLASQRWLPLQPGRSIYATRSGHRDDGSRMTVYLHRAVMERKLGRQLLSTEQVDHRNRNTLDCREENLRLASNRQNARNRSKYRNNKSGYKGVSWDKGAGRWCARIKTAEKYLRLGLFDDPKLAAFAYNLAAVQHHGEFAKLNEDVL
jgi:hypothetical protein